MTLKKSQSSGPEADTLILGLGARIIQCAVDDRGPAATIYELCGLKSSGEPRTGPRSSHLPIAFRSHRDRGRCDRPRGGLGRFTPWAPYASVGRRGLRLWDFEPEYEAHPWWHPLSAAGPYQTGAGKSARKGLVIAEGAGVGSSFAVRHPLSKLVGCFNLRNRNLGILTVWTFPFVAVEQVSAKATLSRAEHLPSRSRS